MMIVYYGISKKHVRVYAEVEEQTSKHVHATIINGRPLRFAHKPVTFSAVSEDILRNGRYLHRGTFETSISGEDRVKLKRHNEAKSSWNKIIEELYHDRTFILYLDDVSRGV